MCRNSKFSKSGHRQRCHIVNLHQFRLIASDGRAREHFREPSQGAPSGKWDWDQHGLEAGLARYEFEQSLVGVDARTTAFIRDRRRFALQHSCDRLRHIFHVGRLQSRKATAEHWIDGEPAEKLEDGGEKRVVQSEHHGGADEDGVGKGGPNRQFAFASLADIERG